LVVIKNDYLKGDEVLGEKERREMRKMLFKGVEDELNRKLMIDHHILQYLHRCHPFWPGIVSRLC
jgi:hypothetical protein